MNQNQQPQNPEILTEEMIRKIIEEGINLSQTWQPHPEFKSQETSPMYNTEEEKEKLVKRVLYSSNPNRSLNFIRGWLKYPLDSETGIGTQKFFAANRIIALIESFKSHKFEARLDSHLKGFKNSDYFKTINIQSFLEEISLFNSASVFFSTNSELNNFETAQGFTIFKANMCVSEFIQEAYVRSWTTDLNDLRQPILVLPEYSVGIVDGMQRMWLGQAIKFGLIADMELDFWKFLEIVIRPLTKDSGDTVDTSLIFSEIQKRSS